MLKNESNILQFTISLRFMLLMSVAVRPLSLGQLSALDYICKRPKQFKVKAKPVEAENRFELSEYLSSKQLNVNSCLELISRGIARKADSEDIRFILTDKGRLKADQLHSLLAKNYRMTAEKVLAEYGCMSEKDMDRIITEKAINR